MHNAPSSQSGLSNIVAPAVVPQGDGSLNAEISFKDHTGIIDALYRFGAGQDTGNPALFASAFARNATLDFTQPAARLGREMPVLEGRDHIVQTIMHSVSGLDTTHTVTNARVDLQGERATLWALVEAQHLPKGNHSSHLLLKNIYTVVLVKEEGAWVMEHLKIDNVWSHGDPAVLFAG